tara:strand:- start:1 stop:210 length:210 start_codon:yes stop_codon:yes gene_type:complete
MVIGGYAMKDNGDCITISNHEEGWTFSLQDEHAQKFREDWKTAERNGLSFEDFFYFGLGRKIKLSGVYK